MHLIAHEGNERRHDEGKRRQQQRRQLIKQRFAGSGRQDGKNVAAVENGGDNFRLPGPKVRVTEPVAQNASRFLKP
jgi:hypothetical protein